MQVVCSPSPEAISSKSGALFALYARPTTKAMGRVGYSIPGDVRRARLKVPLLAWDFLSIALAVVAADQSSPRSISPDGWTRQLEVSVDVADPEPWLPQVEALQDALGFLTGDMWTLSLNPDGLHPPQLSSRRTRRPKPVGDVVCLLSGGLDSLVGALDLVADGRQPLLVSQRAKGDSTKQREFAQDIGATLTHLQLSHAARLPGRSERSQRARSIVFLAYGLLAGAALVERTNAREIELVVPENGFISVNAPLTGLRIGSLSTRTTHPTVLGSIQAIWDAVGLTVRIANPYQLQTKGEMLESCRNQATLRRLAARSTSCGRFGRHGYGQCGRCVPCLIRRASFLKWGHPDETTYKYSDLKSQQGFDDVRSFALACLRAESEGVARWASGAIPPSHLDYSALLHMVERGLGEVRALLEAGDVL